MKAYQVVAISVTLNDGIIQLTNDQIRRRRHLIKVIDEKKNLYQIEQPCHFKKGEVFAYDGEVNKVLLQEISEVGELKKDEDGKPRETKESKEK